jgi:plasmid maintenance system antidote protein VapI
MASMTETLRERLNEAESIRGVARATGTNHAALLRFARGDSHLRLDMADRLAAYWNLELRPVRRSRK